MGRWLVDDVTLLDRLRALVDAVPPGGSVIRDWLAGALQGAAAPAAHGDLTIAQVAERVCRAASTVRGWLERGELTGLQRGNR